MAKEDLTRILYLQSTSEIGGSDISLLRLIAKLDRNRFLPFVILPGEGPLVSQLRALNCNVILMNEMMKLTTRKGRKFYLAYLLKYPKTIWKIAAVIRNENIDLVHTNTIHNLYGFMAAKLTGRPHVWHIREIVFQSKFLRWVERSLTKN